jgi:threonine/homoserine/homoserine lactone efflux protein
VQLLGFVLVAAVVIVVPGPDTALTIRNTLAGGRRSGVATAAGVATGQAVWTIATSAGLAALIVASEPVFRALKLAGAAYLVLLGASALRDAIRGRAPAAHEVRSARNVRGYRQGVLSNLGNPKMAVFFTSLLPQFGGTSFAALLGLGLLFCAMTLTWLTAYAFAVAKAGDLLRRSALRRALDAVVGVVLIALGLRLATERR